MTEKQMIELGYAICDARRMIEIGDIEEAQCQLDRAAELIPDKYWPTKEE
jgi:hypothetical protein